MKPSESRDATKGKIFAGLIVTCLYYAVMLAFLVVMLIVASRTGWSDNLKARVPETVLLCLLVLVLYFIIFYYNVFENKKLFALVKNVAMLYTVLTVSVIVCFLIGYFFNIYARPVALLPLLCVFLFNRREAVLTNFVFAVIMFSVDIYFCSAAEVGYRSEVFYSLILCCVCNPFAVFMASKVHTRGNLLFTGLIISVPNMFLTVALRLPVEWGNPAIPMILSVVYALVGCIFSVVLTLSLLPVFEYVFNRLTVFRLRELTSTNAPILERLKKEAPGTFNHSLIVAQLSESCAVAIGEDAELARAAAYYHDVGKLKQPDCFTENQNGYNVHDELMPELSADIIRSHTRDGYDLLTAEHMPQIIADVALEHHGTLPIKYFYDKAVRYAGDGDIELKQFSYLGPKPRTKIAVIIMITDAAEAVCRAVADRSPETVEKLVRGIIEERMDLGQFENCNITMLELTTIKSTLVEALSGVHHHRVKYPAIRFNRSDAAAVEEDDKSDKKGRR